jgi:PST family polysaccharide transporter
LAGGLDAPDAARYLPGLAAAAVIGRIGVTPSRVLIRSMRFRPVALASATGEVVYTAVATSLAASGWGGDAVIVGNIARASISTGLLIRAADWREWATPVPLRWARFVDMVRFGVPLMVEGIIHSASRYWDTFVIARIFGSSAAGVYSLAYNFADIPAVYVGEHVAGVLMPSMVNLPPARREQAFERATAMLALILFPLATGLGVVAEPLIALVLPAAWQGVAPLVSVLSALSVFRPITWVLSAYLQARGQTGRLMFLELANLVLLLGGIWVLSPLGLEWSAAAVGIAYGINAVAGVWLVSRNGLSVRRVALGFAQPLVACAAMVAGVLAARTMLEGAVPVGAQLAIEIAVGALVYVCVALVVCRATAHALIELARDLMWRRRAGEAREVAP